MKTDNSNEHASLPLCVDLDGTLIYSDSLYELLVRMLKVAPLKVFLLPFWLAGGIAGFKRKLSLRYGKYLRRLPFNEKLLDFLRDQKAAGRRLFLATASDRNFASGLVEDLDLFEDVFGSEGGVNLKASNKAALLSGKFGNGGFAYAGNSSDDLAVWRESGEVIIVNAPASVCKRAMRQNQGKPGMVFKPRANYAGAVLRQLRVHQWTKNLLVFLTLFLSHTYMELPRIMDSVIAFFSLCLAASATYILNDLFDLDADRAHAHKSVRPLASGMIGIPAAFLMMAVLGAAAVVLSLLAGVELLYYLGGYVVLTLCYSFYLKRTLILDVIVLSLLYMFRIQFGAVAITVYVSYWLFSFSIFIFLSLGFLKRFADLKMLSSPEDKVSGRAYKKSDSTTISVIGIACGALSVLLYMNYVEAGAKTMYEAPEYLMYGSVLLIYFISKIWIMASRGKVHSDPIIYAIKTRENYLLVLAFLVLFMLSKPLPPVS